MFWGTPTPVIILTDNKSVTRFLRTTIIPPTLWNGNACDYVKYFSFTITRVPGEDNIAADYLFCLEISPKEKLIRSRYPGRQPNNTD